MTFLEAFNLAGSACIRESRRDLARAIWAARKLGRAELNKVRLHASWVGWPSRERFNGRFA